ncbi:hypothetical protein EIP91_002698 [Steccherinum ochraceum]|uniref:Fungal-type protein kinase domain-containing protein n=1 Tax=Steccherinum ochraceum TaxID=92696 RepID=A0A4R0RDM0_9APHY|nr:hypothetical protein EIP91_002698 [Steccherinum ochraceum]
MATFPATQLPSKSSPLKGSVAGVEQYGSDRRTAKELRPLFSLEMWGLWVGAAPPEEFLRVLLKTDKDPPKTMLARVSFETMPQRPSTEKPMYESFRKILELFKLLPKSFELKDTSATGEESTGLKPDGSVVRLTVFSSWRFEAVEIIVEFKRAEFLDAFRKDWENTKDYLASLSTSSDDTLGQLASYAAAQLARQHRAFIFIVLICGDHARIIRFDRAGAIVTRHFDYRKQPALLAEFFWRYGQQSPVDRGFDPTVQEATNDEKAKLKQAVEAYAVDRYSRRVPGTHDVYDSTFPCYKISVTTFGSDDTRDYIVRKPFSIPLSPIGRCTRGYIALDLASKELVFLKDYWRFLDDARPPEAEIYKDLLDSHVPCLPDVLAAGDVPNDHGSFQTTLTHEWAAKDGMCLCKQIKVYRHHRVVQRIAFPLTTVSNSRQLASAIRNVMESIIVSYEAGWHHRDLTPGNIMLDKKAKGVLNDWDHGIKVDPDRKISDFRSGTWQFVSISLAQNPEKGYELADDLESCYWVFLYTAIHFFDSDADPLALKVFDDCEKPAKALPAGGAKKLMFLTSKSITFTTTHLDVLLDHLRTHLIAIRSAQFLQSAGLMPPYDPRNLLKLFDDALTKSGWPRADATTDRFPRTSTAAQNEDVRRDDQAQTRARTCGGAVDPPAALAGSKRRQRPEVTQADEHDVPQATRKKTKAKSSRQRGPGAPDEQPGPQDDIDMPRRNPRRTTRTNA